MARVTAEWIGLDQLHRGVGAAIRDPDRRTVKAMQRACYRVERRAKQKAPRWRAELQRSITSKVEVRGVHGKDVAGEVGPNTGYSLYVERGTEGPRTGPPLSAIAPWAIAHGISPYLVQRAIARKGTKAQPFLLPALEESRGDIDAEFGRLGLEIAGYISGGLA